MEKNIRDLKYTRINLGKIVPPSNIVTLWTVEENGNSLGFVASAYLNQISPAGISANPLRWGYVSHKSQFHGGIKYLYESRSQAGEALKKESLDSRNKIL